MGNTLGTRLEMLVAGMALFISLSTLGVYLYQAQLMKEQQQASVWPCIEWYTGNVEDFHISVENKGIGPALIRRVEMQVAGKPVANNRELVKAVLGSESDSLVWINAEIADSVIKSGQEVRIFQIPDPKAGRRFEQLLRKAGFQFKITYCSVYGACWESNGRVSIRRPNQRLVTF